jgi:signal transduction histidine kinase
VIDCFWRELGEAELELLGTLSAIGTQIGQFAEHRRAEHQLLQSQKMEAVGQLAGGIAHDFNNLLMVVMGNLQLVEQLVKNDERATKRIRAAIEASEKGSDLTRRMLAFSRQQTLQNKELTLNDLVFSMKDMLTQALTAIVTRISHEVRFCLVMDLLWSVSADANCAAF